MNKSKILMRSCAAALSLLGVTSGVMHARGNYKVIEGFKLQDSMECVYGGRENYIKTKLYGKVLSAKTKEALAGIKVALYDGTNEMASAFTDENGNYYLDDLGLWGGLGVEYTMIVSDPKKKHRSLKRDLTFDVGEVSREELVILESKK